MATVGGDPLLGTWLSERPQVIDIIKLSQSRRPSVPRSGSLPNSCHLLTRGAAEQVLLPIFCFFSQVQRGEATDILRWRMG